MTHMGEDAVMQAAVEKAEAGLAALGIDPDGTVIETVLALLECVKRARQEGMLAERAACVADVEAELEYPSAPSQLHEDLKQKMMQNPVVAIQSAVALTKQGIVNRIQAREAHSA